MDFSRILLLYFSHPIYKLPEVCLLYVLEVKVCFFPNEYIIGPTPFIQNIIFSVLV